MIRATIIGLIAFIAMPASAQDWKPSNGEQLAFDVYRDGSKFGTHIVSFRKSGDDLTVTSDVHLNVSFGLLTLFDYILASTEHWKGDQLISIAARTKSDGKWKPLAVEAVETGFRIAGTGFRGVIPGPLIPSSHWNAAEMRQPAMLSIETGALLPMTVIDKGLEQVKTGQGLVEARHYLVKSEIEASFWYDAADRWVKCSFTAQGSHIDYVLRALPG
jgi:hypothetical protein